MKATPKMKNLLARMASIERMERGTLCRMTGRAHYNHQTWRHGCNESRYVPAGDVAALKKALAGYRQFLKLVERYVDEVVAQTRKERAESLSPASEKGLKTRKRGRRTTKIKKTKQNADI